MAITPIIMSGVFYPKNKKDPPLVGTFIGNAGIYGLEVGYPLPTPPDQPPTQPPVEGAPPHPVFPIWGPPGIELPDSPGYPPVASHPLPPLQDPPAQPPNVDLVPGWDFKTGWTEETG